MKKYLVLSISRSTKENHSYGEGVVHSYYFGCESKCYGTNVFSTEFTAKGIADTCGWVRKSGALNYIKKLQNMDMFNTNKSWTYEYQVIEVDC